MGAITDVVDLLTQLATRVKDRKLAGELNKIQSLILGIQSEHAEIHETNIKLREENLTLKERVHQLQAQLTEMSSARPIAPAGVPTCPNCSTKAQPFFMRPVPRDFVEILGATHECPRCKFNTKSGI